MSKWKPYSKLWVSIGYVYRLALTKLSFCHVTCISERHDQGLLSKIPSFDLIERGNLNCRYMYGRKVLAHRIIRHPKLTLLISYHSIGLDEAPPR